MAAFLGQADAIVTKDNQRKSSNASITDEDAQTSEALESTDVSAAAGDVSKVDIDEVSESANAEKTFSFPVIGVGASAGGLESLEQLFSELPDDTLAAFVVVQHLSPDFKSMMDEILRRHTKMTVSRIEHGMLMKPKTVYLIPPNSDLELDGKHFKLCQRDLSSGVSYPIDRFFTSLAKHRGASCAALVCSGSGSDGSRGIRDICEHGGMVLVEDPEVARFDGMPRAAVESGIVDFVAPISQLAIWLGRFIESYNNNTLTAQSAAELELATEEYSGLKAVTMLLRSEYGIDFLQYKPNMILRRIERRLQLVHLSSMDQYVNQLKEDPDELNQLYRDLLIGVTRFFRDRDAFELLSSQILPDIVEASRGRTLRIWTPGCATGEEAYSLAMRVNEAFDRVGREADVKIFATDAHRLSLERAALGIYSAEQLVDVPQNQIEKYFSVSGANYQVKQFLRKMVVFAPHNLLRDASFTKVDLVVCRNTLIYFKVEGQRRALSLMHFGLRTGGYLFLGPSETPSHIQDDYEVVNRRWRIYRKVGNSHGGLTDLRVPNAGHLPEEGGRLRSSASLQADKLILTSLENMAGNYMPPSFVTDAEFRLLYSTEGAADFIRRQHGKFDATLPDLLLPSLKTTVLLGLQRSSRQSSTEPLLVGTIAVPVNLGGNNHENQLGQESADKPSETPLNVRVIISKVLIPNDKSHGFLVTFETASQFNEQRESFVADLDSDVRMSLENELRHTKDSLQASIEELETSNEELQATNEEMVASNEELQSTNEEVHSVNEELYTVNSEHQNKIEELTELTEDMKNLFRASDIATIFLDEELKIRRLTPKAGEIFDLTQSDIGRPLENFRNPLRYKNLYVDIAATIEKSTLEEREVQSSKGDRYLLRLLPYSSSRASVGVVLTLIDLHRLEAARQALETREARFRGTFENAAIGIAHVEFNGNWLRVNEQVCQIVGYDRDELLASDFQAITHPEDLDHDLEQFEQLKSGEIESYSLRKRYIHKDGHDVPIDLTVSSQNEPGRRDAYCIAFIRDATRSVAIERQLEEGVKQRDQFMAVLSHELRNPLASCRNAIQLLKRIQDDTDSDKSNNEAYVNVLDRQTTHMTRLVEDLLDTSRIAQNKIKLQRELIDMKAVVIESVESMRSGFLLKQQAIELEIDGETFPVVGDRTRLLQVFENLLSNSRRYTQRGGEIKVRLSVKQGRVEISVSDNGSGIEKSKIDTIFSMFARAHETQETQGGLGIGLALARMLMEQHDGEISASSDGLGKGSTFTIHLPLVPVPKTGVIEEPIKSKGSSQVTEKFNIVIVDDDDDARMTMQALLQLDGHDVSTAPDGLAGLLLIADIDPDFALVDLSMPGLNGVQLANELRKQHRSSTLIAITGHGKQQDRDRTAEAGFRGHLVKPVDVDELNRLMKTLSES